MEISRGRGGRGGGVQKTNFLNNFKYDTKMEFPKGWEGGGGGSNYMTQ